MPDLLLHGRPVETVFDLIGHRENDMTFALGWGLKRSAPLLRRLVERVAPGVGVDEPVLVELQEHGESDRGYTDIEIVSPDLHLIVEAKRGWEPPEVGQLRRYEGRLASTERPVQRLVILTQNGAEAVVRHLLGDWTPPPPIEIEILGWSDLVRIARAAGREGAMADRHLAAELATYLRGVADMRDAESNRVLVVALGTSPWDGWSIAPLEVVTRYSRYFFPASGRKGWPKYPPNYIAFRYSGRLQSIHHVDDYTIIDRPRPHIAEAADEVWDTPHFLVSLGPPIAPGHEVRTGRGIRRSAHVWADIDLLLTASTITEARDRSATRRTG